MDVRLGKRLKAIFQHMQRLRAIFQHSKHYSAYIIWGLSLHSSLLHAQLLLLPDFRSGSAFYAAQEATSDINLLDIEPCLPRSVALSGVREQCRDIVFALSVEFYGQVFGE